MKIVEVLGYVVIFLVPFGLLLIAFISALGKRPGYRRRLRNSSHYSGPERRKHQQHDKKSS